MSQSACAYSLFQSQEETYYCGCPWHAAKCMEKMKLMSKGKWTVYRGGGMQLDGWI